MTNIVHNLNNEEIIQYPDKYFDIAIIDPRYNEFLEKKQPKLF